MDKEELLNRTRQFAIGVFRIVEKFPKCEATRVLNPQLLRSASSVAANYRAANRAKSRPDFANKLKIVLEEADESNFWLTFAADIGLISMTNPELQLLINESDQLVSIFSASVKND